VAQGGTFAAGQQRGHPPALASQRGVADGIDTAEHCAQPTRVRGAADRAVSQAGSEQLLAADHAVLAISEPTNHLVALLGAFFSHTENKAPRAANSPPFGAEVAP
jgi:hypothetical protein